MVGPQSGVSEIDQAKYKHNLANMQSPDARAQLQLHFSYY